MTVHIVRWVGLIALLILELILLTIRFDTETLAGNSRWWSEWLGEAHFLPQLGLTIVVTLIVFGGDRLWRGVFSIINPGMPTHSWWIALVVHLIVFVLFALVTRQVLERTATGVTADLWFLTWVVLVLVLGCSWALAALPARIWWRVAVQYRGAILIAFIAGAVAFGAGRITEKLWEPMADFTLSVVHSVLKLGFAHVQSEPTQRIIGTPEFAVQIAPSCSGYEGLGLVFSFIGLYLWLRRDELIFPNALIILPVGLLAAWLANILRIVGLIAVGTLGWPEVARGGFHSQAGWLAFNVIALGLVAVSRRSSWLCRVANAPARTSDNLTAPHLLPLIAVVGTAMVTGALSSTGFDSLYALRVLFTIVVFLVYRKVYAGLGWSEPWAALGIGFAVFFLWMMLEYLIIGWPMVSGSPDELASLSPLSQSLWIVGRILGGVVIVPFAEELAFRGFLMRRIQSSEFDTVPANRWSWSAVLISSFVFGVLHPDRWIAGTIAGILYAWVYTRRGRLGDAILAHAITNALLAAYVLITGHWQLW